MSELEFLSPDRAKAGNGWAPLLKSSVERRLRNAGAEFEVREGWLVATHVPNEERCPLGVRDVSHIGKIEVRGNVNDLDADGAEVVRITPRRALVLCPYREGAALRRELEAHFATVLDMTAALAALGVDGPQATTLMRRLTDLDLDGLPATGRVADVRAVVLRDGAQAFRFFFPQEYGSYLWDVAIDAALPLGGGPVGADLT